MDRRDIYESLLRVVPRDPQRLLSVCEAKVNSFRENILLKQRQILLLQLDDHVRSPAFFPPIPSLFDAINRDISVLAETISPQQVQFISKIYDWFLHNIQELVTVVAAASRRYENMHFFAYSIVPSFFGYFSTAEHLRSAFTFYCALVVHVPKPLTSLLLAPFFCNSATYRYIEALTSDLVNWFCQDIRLYTNQSGEHLMEEHRALFLKSMMGHLRLLPAPHLNLLTLLHRYQWSSDSIFQFFLKSFVTPQLIRHFVASPLSSYLEPFRYLVLHMSGNVLASSVKPLFKAESIFEVPDAFSDFQDPGLSFVTTPLDVAVFLDVVKDCVKLPRLLVLLESPKYLGFKQPFAPIWIKVFPRNPPPRLYSDIWRHVVFRNVTKQVKLSDWEIPHFDRRYRQIRIMANEALTDPVSLLESSPRVAVFGEEKAVNMKGFCRKCTDPQKLCESCRKIAEERETVSFHDFTLNLSLGVLRDRALAFERLLVHRFVLQRLSVWNELIEASHTIGAYTVAEKYLISVFRTRETSEPPELLMELGAFADSPHIRQISFSIHAEKIFNMFQLKHEARFVEMRKLWKTVLDELIKEKMTPLTMKRPKMGVALKRVMAMRNILGTVHIVTFYRRYFRIMEVLKALSFMEHAFALPDTSLLRYTVAWSDPDDPAGEFLETVLGISALLLHTVGFVIEIGKEANRQWHWFEEVVTSFVRNDRRLEKLYQELDEELLSL
jgi:hypothetical protein